MLDMYVYCEIFWDSTNYIKSFNQNDEVFQ